VKGERVLSCIRDVSDSLHLKPIFHHLYSWGNSQRLPSIANRQPQTTLRKKIELSATSSSHLNSNSNAASSSSSSSFWRASLV